MFHMNHYLGINVRNPVLRGLRTTKAQKSLRSLIFVIRLLERIISRLAPSEISIFLLVSVAEQDGLNLSFFGNLKTSFLAPDPSSSPLPMM